MSAAVLRFDTEVAAPRLQLPAKAIDCAECDVAATASRLCPRAEAVDVDRLRRDVKGGLGLREI